MRNKLAEHDDNLLFLDPPETFDQCMLGLATCADGTVAVAYDRMRCIEALMADGMDREEAEEYFEFNTAGAYVGPHTPIFIDQRYCE
jgi:hypothetical protein